MDPSTPSSSKYRPILPVGGLPTDGRPDSSDPSSRKRKRNATRIACNMCRSRRSKCDGARPKCSRCLERRSECVYISISVDETPTMHLKREKTLLEVRNQQLEALVEYMAHMPEDEAADAFAILRVTRDPGKVLRTMQSDDLNREILLSLHGAMKAGFRPGFDSPSTKEVELMVRWPKLYPKDEELFAGGGIEGLMAKSPLLMKREVLDGKDKNVPFKGILKSPTKSFDRPSTASRTLNSSFAVPSASSSSSGIAVGHPGLAVMLGMTSGLETSASLHGSQDTTHIGPVTHVASPPKFQEFKSSKLNIRLWTDVLVSSEFAVNVINHYFEHEHINLGILDAELFIKDLMNDRDRFATPFLFTAILALGCLSYTAFDEASSRLSREFAISAERMIDTQHVRDDIAKLSGLHILSLAFVSQGKSDLGNKYCEMGRQLGLRMKMFGDGNRVKISDFQPNQMTELKATACAAWGAFSCQTLVSSHFFLPGVLIPPALPIPGDNPGDDSSELWFPLPDYMGKSFTCLCQFWCIIAEVNAVYYDQRDQRPLTDRVDQDFAAEKYIKIVEWLGKTPAEMDRTPESPAHVLIVHMWCHCAIIDIFRPFIPSNQLHGLSSNSNANKFDESGGYGVYSHILDPSTILSASVLQLKRLIGFYAGRFPDAKYNLCWQAGLLYVASSAIKETSNPLWRFWFLTCLKCYQDLYYCFPLFETIIQAILSMAMREGAVKAREARILLQRFKDKGKHHRQAAKDVADRLMSENRVDIGAAIGGMSGERNVATFQNDDRTAPNGERFSVAIILDRDEAMKGGDGQGDSIADRFEEMTAMTEFTTINDQGEYHGYGETENTGYDFGNDINLTFSRSPINYCGQPDENRDSDEGTEEDDDEDELNQEV